MAAQNLSCLLDLTVNFPRHLTAAQSLTFNSTFSSFGSFVFVSVYCLNFIVVLCVTLELFFLSFNCAPLAPNPSDAIIAVKFKPFL